MYDELRSLHPPRRRRVEQRLAFPWFGTGLNTYGSATLLLQDFEKATALYVEAHNDYLQLLVIPWRRPLR
jgi:hypothetical protein